MHSVERSVLITSAALSYKDQLASRKRRYATLMGGRVVLLLLAAAAYGLSPWLSVALLALSIPLPWMAVLIANDRPARKVEDAHRLRADRAWDVNAAPSPRAVIDTPVSDERRAPDRDQPGSTAHGVASATASTTMLSR